MLFTKLSTIVQAIRLRYAIPFVLLLVVIYLAAIQPWMANWGSTADEQEMALPGDELLFGPTSTLAVTINASPDAIWPWLVQIGQDRAGFYSYTWLENLLGVSIHNTNEIRPEWQQLAVGDDAWRMVPADYMGGVGKDSTKKVLMIEPEQVLVLEMWGAHVLLPIGTPASGNAATRLIVRGETDPGNLMKRLFIDPMVFTMERRMLLGIKARAEGRPDAPAVLMIIAVLGWAVTGITVTGLFVSQGRRGFWMVLPIVAALPALLMSHDVQAGLTAFLAVGIPILGFLMFRRHWWGSILVIASLAMLTVLLAPEAYTAIGLAFALVFLPALGLEAANRRRTPLHQARTAS